MSLVDLSDLEEADREAALAQERALDVERPFDLLNGPLVRVRLIRTAPREHHLFLTVHHAICDGWSSGTLLTRLTEIYTAERRGERPALPPAMQLSEYVDWFERYQASTDRAADERFWMEHVTDDFPTTDLPLDRPRPARRSYRADQRTVRLEPDAVQDLHRLATAQKSTLFTLLLGSFECLIARLARTEEIGLAVSIAGQTRFPGRDLVAHCINALPLRRAVSATTSFADHLVTTQATFLDAFDHQDFSYGAIVRSTRARRRQDRPPLTSISFNMDSPSEPLSMDGAVAVPGSNPRHAETFDVFLNIVPQADALVIECTYNVDLFDAASIDRRLNEWMALLSHLRSAGLEVPVGELGIVPPADLELLAQWNATGVERDERATLVSLFQAAVAGHPDRIAVEFGERQLTYAELERMATRIARRLVELGAGPGAMVGLLCERSVELVAAVYGIVMARAAYVPLDPEYPADRIGYMVEETEMRVVLGQDRFRGLVTDPGVVMLDIDELLRTADADAGDAAQLPPVEPDDVAYVIYTSGSTGRPKGVANAHRGVVNRMLWTQERFGLGPDDVVLQKTPFSFDVSVWEFFWPLQTGARLVVAAPGGHRDPAYLVETIVRHGVDTIHFVPSMLRLFLDHPAAGSCLSLRRVICSGEALTRDLVDRFFAVLPAAELHNLYGPTEAAIDVTAWQCRPDDTLPVVPIGAPVANTTIHILDEQMRPVPIGTPGELYIGGVQVAVGYVNRHDLTAERFIPDPFDPSGRLYRTGDLARWLPSGQVDFLGRLDHQVKLRGQRIELGEIEATLGLHPSVLEAAVTIGHDTTGDALLVAWLVPRSGLEIDEAPVREFLRGRLPAHMIPTHFTVLDHLPLSASGKLDVNALPIDGQLERLPADGLVEPRTKLEVEIAQLWTEILGTPAVGVESDFFDLGGHSLKLMQLASRFDQTFGVRPAIADLFEAPTVASQALLLTEALVTDNLSGAEILAEIVAGQKPGLDGNQSDE